MTFRDLLKDPSKTEVWSQLASSEFCKLMDGNKYGVTVTQAMVMVDPKTILREQLITYTSMVFDYCPLKQESHIMWLHLLITTVLQVERSQITVLTS